MHLCPRTENVKRLPPRFSCTATNDQRQRDGTDSVRQRGVHDPPTTVHPLCWPLPPFPFPRVPVARVETELYRVHTGDGVACTGGFCASAASPGASRVTCAALFAFLAAKAASARPKQPRFFAPLSVSSRFSACVPSLRPALLNSSL